MTAWDEPRVTFWFQKELLNNLADVLYPKFLKMFEKALEENGGKYFVGDSVSKRHNTCWINNTWFLIVTRFTAFILYYRNFRSSYN